MCIAKRSVEKLVAFLIYIMSGRGGGRVMSYPILKLLKREIAKLSEAFGRLSQGEWIAVITSHNAIIT